MKGFDLLDFSKRLSISYYKSIATLNDEHKVYLVQHQESQKIFVKKFLNVYNADIYQHLQTTPIVGIPQIIEMYEDDHSLQIIEEYISGETLQDKIDARSLAQSDITHYINELCIILNKLHSLNPPIIHRDIKPSNIIITSYNHVVLLDFNAAKYFTIEKSSDTVLLGTKGYAAPEQYGFGSSSQQTDIYAIGVLLKELAYSLKTPTHEFDDIISKCTQINPADRFKSVSELQTKLSTEQTNDNAGFLKIESWKSLIPPGFRTHTPWRMILATIGYLLIFWLCLTLETEDVTGIGLWIERIFCLSIFLSVVFSSSNYLNIQKIIPLCQHKNHIIHFIGIIILNVMFISVLMFSMVILLGFFHI
ncbi:serine/threonine protein kinase [Anaerobium acetethylicum]|uniref:serine/threonine protein kinase n=1 Tax=Anaerobium acetethylicum TaxID=1619234 RepID=UPI000B817049|nr:protein kinase [Anaerobium acetethylicum]